MSTFTIPNSNRQIRQANRGDIFGEIVESFNIDLNTNLGKIKTSKKLFKALDETDDLSIGVPIAFEVYDGKYWVMTGDQFFKCDVTDDVTDSTNWSEETGISGSGVNNDSDLTVFGGLLLASADQDITSWNGSVDNTSWWTTTVSGSALTSGEPHVMHVHRGGQETLFVTDNNLVRYYNATAGHSTVTLQSDLTACSVNSGVNATWVGTYTNSGSHAYVYEIYVGEQLNSTPIARNAYKVDGRAVLSIEVINNIPYIITEKGNLQAFNGSGFTTVASFPFAYTTEELNGVRIGNILSSSTRRPVHPKGMKQHNDSLLINIFTELVTDDYAEKSPSGVWEYNKQTGVLNHRNSLCDTTDVFGEKNMQRSGPILITDNQYTFLMVGGETEQGGDAGVFMESDYQNQGYFITTEIESETVEDAYEAVYLKAKTLAAGEEISIKYRTTKQDRQLFTGTFATSNVLNTTDTLTIESGDEVTITEGSNSGKIAHVISVEGSTTKSLTLDTAIGTVGDTVRAEALNFKPIGYDSSEGYDGTNLDPYTSDDGEYKKLGGFGTSPWIQFKVVMKGDIELRQFICKGNSKVEL